MYTKVVFSTVPAAPGKPKAPTVIGKPTTSSISVRLDGGDDGGADITAFVLEMDEGKLCVPETEQVCLRVCVCVCVCVCLRGCFYEYVCASMCLLLTCRHGCFVESCNQLLIAFIHSFFHSLHTQERKASGPSGSFRRLYSGLEPDHVVPDLQPGTLYHFRVLCQNPTGSSDYSDFLRVSTAPVCPAAPAKVECRLGKAKASVVNVRWAQPAYCGGAPVTLYRWVQGVFCVLCVCVFV